jgi:flagellar biosynthesis/type III secretory pathway chaperone
MKAIVDSLEMKINKLISLYTVTKQEKVIIVNENANLKNELAEKQEVVKELEEKIKVIKISSLVSSNDEDKKKTKQKINEYVREIDRCIALLNK